MAGAAQQQGGGADNSLSALWLTVLLFVTLGAVWYFFHTELVTFWFNIKLVELNFIDLFTDNADDIKDWIHDIDPSSVSFKEVTEVSREVGYYLMYPAAGTLGIFAFLSYLNNAKTRFTRNFDMNSKASYEMKNWPQITPVVKLDLVSEHVEKGKWAMAATPMQFAVKHDLLEDIEQIANNDYARKMRSVASVNRGRAKKVFALQLGKQWQGVQKLPPHVKALFAVFAAKANRDRDGCTNLLDQISASTFTGKYDFSGTERLLIKHIRVPSIMKIMQHHAYVYTVMASMLEHARDDGVMASSDFLWLKPLDRRLWFVLNGVGRCTAACDIAGIYAHWLAEKELGYPLRVPVVDEAVVGLEYAISMQIYLPDDYKKEEKK